MFTLYVKDGSWRISGVEGFFNTQEEAIQTAVDIGSSKDLEEFEIRVEEQPKPGFSPYEEILGFNICHRCFLHPCEC